MLDMMLYFSDEFKVHSFVKNNFWNHDVKIMHTLLWRVKRNYRHASFNRYRMRHKFRLEITLEKAQLELSGILSGSKSYGEEN